MRAWMHRCPIWLVLFASFACTSRAAAQESTAPIESEPAACRRPWTFRVIPYLWAPAFEGDLTVRNVAAPIDVSVGQTLDLFVNQINFAALGQFEASNGRVGMVFNGIYTDLQPGREVRRLDFSADLQLTILDTVLTYELTEVAERFLRPGSRLELLAGVRYYSLSSIFTLTGPRGNSASDGGTEDWQDLILGARIRVPLRRCWTAQLRGDIGGFDIGEASQFSWNIEAIVEWRRSDRLSIFAGYRCLDIDYVAGSGSRTFGFDMMLHGPMMGFAFDF